jgi:hypothetical protein
LLHVITQFRGVLAERASDQLSFSTTRHLCSTTFNSQGIAGLSRIK